MSEYVFSPSFDKAIETNDLVWVEIENVKKVSCLLTEEVYFVVNPSVQYNDKEPDDSHDYLPVVIRYINPDIVCEIPPICVDRWLTAPLYLNMGHPRGWLKISFESDVWSVEAGRCAGLRNCSLLELINYISMVEYAAKKQQLPCYVGEEGNSSFIRYIDKHKLFESYRAMSYVLARLTPAFTYASVVAAPVVVTDCLLTDWIDAFTEWPDEPYVSLWGELQLDRVALDLLLIPRFAEAMEACVKKFADIRLWDIYHDYDRITHTSLHWKQRILFSVVKNELISRDLLL